MHPATDWWDMPRDRLLAVYREAYQQEERETFRARTIMTDIKLEVLREITLPQYTAQKLTSAGQRPATHWLSEAVARDLVELMELGILSGEIFAEWPASPEGQPLSLIWEEVAKVAGG